ncbi:class I SAM-dependent DNA methyltransferase [Anaerococcus sp.]|uniref:type I restriction-modification system subunit M n=1 Tax=Anaerococcus sp. TaxID=1872515 RepID=UPI0029005277|nr:class I SAM-dependent DNA methyltransferase [Anaerococcus sp.]MDU1829180.1 class I SAM-dependent DNA methyltransferase [Anaerococcus sp.]MDU1864482.1 class I SAM-dependent DNA methyltransferase [Anaerococcus sp.]
MSIGSFVKNIQNIMRGDSGINGDAQRIETMTWMLFLKVYDSKEEDWELYNDDYESIIPEDLRWRNWAVDNMDGEALTGDNLLDFVNNKLFPTLKNLEVNEFTEKRKLIVKEVFEDTNQYMKDGVLLRKVINVIDEIDFDDAKEKNAFGHIYETILKSLQSAGNAGEFYTPRAVTDFCAQMIQPQIGDRVADLACGTGGFLTSAISELELKIKSVEDREILNKSIYGIEKKPLPYLLAVTNMLIHDIDNPYIYHDNSLAYDVRDYKDSDKFDVIMMNPPYGGTETEGIKINFPADLRSSETADLFMSLIMYRLREDGRAAVVLPDGFMFGTDNVKMSIKQKLINEFNLHTIVRLPASVFAPYTSITTNILFFDKTHPTETTWFYRVDMPEGYKHFSKTKPMKLEHLDDVRDWWNERLDIEDKEIGHPKVKAYSRDEIIANNYNLDLVGFPNIEEEILSPEDTIREYKEKRASLNAEIDQKLAEIEDLLGIKL